jgi:aspartate/methionine/tyrosine aminotransferase
MTAVLTLEPASPAPARLALPFPEIIDLSIGDPADPTPQQFKDGLAALLTDPRVDHYPDPVGDPALLEAVAAYYRRRFGINLDPDSDICVTSGALPALSLALRAAATTRQVCGYAEPSYFGIPYAIRAAGLLPQPIRFEDLLGDNDRVDKEFARFENGSFVLNTPHNPTGTVLAPHELYRIAAAARAHRVAVVADGVYAELFGIERPESFLGFDPNSVEISSFSKTFRMCGWRCGFVVGQGGWIARLRDLRQNADNGVPLAIQIAAAGLLDDMTGVDEFRAEINERRAFLADRLEPFGFTVNTAALRAAGTNFLWVGMPSSFSSSAEASGVLLSAGVNVLPGSMFGVAGEGFLRFSLNFPIPVLDEVARRIEGALDQKVENQRYAIDACEGALT